MCPRVGCLYVVFVNFNKNWNKKNLWQYFQISCHEDLIWETLLQFVDQFQFLNILIHTKSQFTRIYNWPLSCVSWMKHAKLLGCDAVSTGKYLPTVRRSRLHSKFRKVFAVSIALITSNLEPLKLCRKFVEIKTGGFYPKASGYFWFSGTLIHNAA
jgi:hypothetical protein